jgi:antitoxin HicB
MDDDVKTIPRVTPPWPFEAYAHMISPLPPEEGGGFLLTIPDLPGCLSDGETEEEALSNGRDAFQIMISGLVDMGREIPAPTFAPEKIDLPRASGRFVTRLPKSLHARLASRARQEGVSLNTLAMSLIAEGLGKRSATASA